MQMVNRTLVYNLKLVAISLLFVNSISSDENTHLIYNVAKESKSNNLQKLHLKRVLI